MRLLIITQKVDKDDPILGFFHTWLLRLSEKFESIIVICLQGGKHELSRNVKVLSLGKENGESKLKYVRNFYKYIWLERSNYDAVFVHMNQEYVLLGWKIWKLLGKKIYFWRNHPQGNIITRLAIALSTKVFYTSPNSFTAEFKKSKIMPVGIDTDRFQSSSVNRKQNSILSLGRISPVKNIHLIAEVAKILRQKEIPFVLDIVGDPINPGDVEYKKSITEPISPGVPNYRTPELYQTHDVLLNLTFSGSLDKTILEAAACGCVPFFHTKIEGLSLGVEISDLDPLKIALRLKGWFETSEERKNQIRGQLKKFVLENHSLNALIERLEAELT